MISARPVFWDRNAFNADAVVAVNRVKAHTDFRGPIESGIVKMIVIGLGKRESAAQVHRLGCTGMTDMVPSSARVVLAKTKFALGLAILENAHDETAILKAVEPEEVFTLEPTLLEQAKAMMGRLPFDEADVLLVGEIGKNYSGTGMDPNVIGRRFLENEPDFPSPRITRIAAARHLSREPRQFDRRRLRRSLHQTARRFDRSECCAAQRLHRSIAVAGEDPDHVGRRPIGTDEGARNVLGDAAENSKTGVYPEHT